jgi:hypothetical protein
MELPVESTRVRVHALLGSSGSVDECDHDEDRSRPVEKLRERTVPRRRVVFRLA